MIQVYRVTNNGMCFNFPTFPMQRFLGYSLGGPKPSWWSPASKSCRTPSRTTYGAESRFPSSRPSVRRKVSCSSAWPSTEELRKSCRRRGWMVWDQMFWTNLILFWYQLFITIVPLFGKYQHDVIQTNGVSYYNIYHHYSPLFPKYDPR